MSDQAQGPDGPASASAAEIAQLARISTQEALATEPHPELSNEHQGMIGSVFQNDLEISTDSSDVRSPLCLGENEA